jgi:cytochrome c1
MRRGWLAALLALLLFALLAGCNRDAYRVEKSVPGGNPMAGRTAIVANGCVTCHVIPGVAEKAFVGPPLNEYAQRHYIAGNMPNTAENLVLWIQYPQRFEPGTAMPDLGLSEGEARNIAAYLYEN